MTIVELFAQPASWVKKFDAKGPDDYTRAPAAADAVCWCLRGACMRLYTDVEGAEGDRIAAAVKKMFPERFTHDTTNGDVMVNFNDHRLTVREDVIAVAREANV